MNACKGGPSCEGTPELCPPLCHVSPRTQEGNRLTADGYKMHTQHRALDNSVYADDGAILFLFYILNLFTCLV